MKVLDKDRKKQDELINSSVLGVFKRLSVANNKMREHKADWVARGFECEEFNIGYCTLTKGDRQIKIDIEETFFNEQ